MTRKKKKSIQAPNPGTVVWGMVDKMCVAFEPKDATAQEIRDIVDYLSKHIMQESQLESIRKAMKDQGEF